MKMPKKKMRLLSELGRGIVSDEIRTAQMTQTVQQKTAAAAAARAAAVKQVQAQQAATKTINQTETRVTIAPPAPVAPKPQTITELAVAPTPWIDSMPATVSPAPTVIPVKPAAPAPAADPLTNIINNMVSGVQALFKKIGLGQINFRPPYKTNEWDGLSPPYQTNQWDGTIDDLGKGK